MTTPPLALSALRDACGGLDHPEGVAAGPAGELWAGGEAGQVYRVEPLSGAVEQVASTGGLVLGLALDASGTVYVCDQGRGEVLRVDPASGAVEPWCEAAGGSRLVCPNWPAFGPGGELWVSDSGTEAVGACDGRLVRVPPGGGDGEVIDVGPLDFPNGLAVSADGAVHLLESFRPRLTRLGPAGLELVAELPGVVPDGVALDADGGYVIGCYYPYRILHVRGEGEHSSVEVLLDDPWGIHMIMPTNVAFHGPDRSQLAIAQYGGYGLKSIATPLRGAPLHAP